MDFGVLGPVLVVDGARALALTSMQRILIARLLVSANQTVSVGRLIEDVFVDARPGNPDAALLNHVSRLRKVLANGGSRSDVLVRKAGGYCLEIDDDDLDASRFERLAGAGRHHLDGGDPVQAASLLGRALSLWRGPALADVAFVHFAQAEASRLEELRLSAREDHAAARLAAGAAREVILELEALVADHPLRERPWALLMVALARCGRQAEALRVYQRVRRLLDDQLGLAPSAELRELELAILRQDPSLGRATPLPLEPALPSVERQPAHNLPMLMSRFVGRREEQGSLISLLATSPVVTLTGIGGTGKTRLALEVAAAIHPSTPDGVWLVDLSRLTAHAQVLPAVATALGVPEQPGVGLHDAVTTAVRRSRMLLVLDSCEHHLPTVASLVSTLVDASPGIRVLATSRRPLGLHVEHVHPVPPLGVPSSTDASLEVIAASEAVRLFVDRAEQVKPGFALDETSAQPVAAICRRLDGIPLAIELAAARLDSLGLDQVRADIDDRFGLMDSGAGLTPVSQGTVLAALEWSHNLLGEAERRVLRRLSVFEGGAALSAAEAVCAGDGLDAQAVHGVLGRLVSATLAVADTSSGEARFRLLDEVRSFARARLAESGEGAVVARAHAGWCLALAEAAEPQLEGPAQLAWLARLDADQGNLRAALAWALEEKEAELSLRLATGLTLYWHLRCCFGEGLGWLEGALGAGEAPPALRAKALLGSAWLCSMRGADLGRGIAQAHRAGEFFAADDDGKGVARSLLWLAACMLHGTDGPEQARHYSDRAAAGAREAGDRWCTCLAMCLAGWSDLHRGVARGAWPLFEQALGEARRSGDRLGLELSLTGLGHVAMECADNAAAERLLTEALLVARELNHAYVECDVLSRLGKLAADAADYGRAEVLLREGLTASARAGSDSSVADCLCRLGSVALTRNDLEAAAGFFDEARALAEQRGHVDGAALLGLGEVCVAQEEYERARVYFESGCTIAAEKGNGQAVAWALHELGTLALREGDHRRAAALHGEALAHRVAVGDTPGLARSLGVVAALATLGGHHQAAATLAGSALRWRGSVPFPRWWSEQPLVEPVLRQLRARLEAAVYEEAWSDGERMSEADAGRQALAICEALTLEPDGGPALSGT